MQMIDKQDEQRILEALESAVVLTNDGLSPNEALQKIAEEKQFTPQVVQRMIEAFNVSKTLAHFKHADDGERAGSFPLAEAAVVLGSMFPKEPEIPAQKAADVYVPDDYSIPEQGDFMRLFKPERDVEIPSIGEIEPHPYDRNGIVKSAYANYDRIKQRVADSKSAFEQCKFRLIGHIQKAAQYFKRIPHESFALVEEKALYKFGAVAKPVMGMIHADAHCHEKRAEAVPQLPKIFDHHREPYCWVEGAIKAARDLRDLAERHISDELLLGRYVQEHHEILHPGLSDRQPMPKAAKDSILSGFDPDDTVKEAGDMPSFTSQDRPKKVKDIYKALKRDHPGMSAEMKARIAARQGKPGKQKQGPPYKAPLAKKKKKKKEAALDGFLGGSNPVPFREKEAVSPVEIAGTALAGAAGSTLLPGAEVGRQQALSDILDPAHEAEMASIRVKAMITDMMSNDPVIATYAPDEVTNAYNQISSMVPLAARQPAFVRGMLRKMLQQQDVLEPFEAEQLTKLETGLQRLSEAPLGPTVHGTAPRGS